VLLAAVVEVAVIYHYLGGARACWFCSDCCWSL